MEIKSVSNSSLKFLNINKGPVSIAAEPSTGSSSSRAGMRRLRTETPTFSYPCWNDTSREQLEALEEPLLKAFQKNDYKAASDLIDQIQKLQTSPWDFPPGLEWVMLFPESLSQVKACCLALNDRPQDALELFAEAKQSLESYIEFFKMLDTEGEVFDNIQQWLHLIDGLLLLSNNDPEKAIAALQEAGKMHTVSGIHLLLGSLEKHLGVQLIEPIKEGPSTEAMDVSERLFLARRYEEAIAALANPKDAAEMDRRGHCHAMLGQLDEALAWYDRADQLHEENSFFYFDGLDEPEAEFFLKRRLAHLLAGDLEEAKRSENASIYFDNEVEMFNEVCALPLNVAIHWIEQQQK